MRSQHEPILLSPVCLHYRSITHQWPQNLSWDFQLRDFTSGKVLYIWKGGRWVSLPREWKEYGHVWVWLWKSPWSELGGLFLIIENTKVFVLRQIRVTGFSLWGASFHGSPSTSCIIFYPQNFMFKRRCCCFKYGSLLLPASYWQTLQSTSCPWLWPIRRTTHKWQKVRPVTLNNSKWIAMVAILVLVW